VFACRHRPPAVSSVANRDLAGSGIPAGCRTMVTSNITVDFIYG